MLHPQARAMLKLIEDNKMPPTHTLAPEAARAMYLPCACTARPAAGPARSCRRWSTTTAAAG